VGPAAIAENSCGGQAYVNFSVDRAWVRDPAGGTVCNSVAIRTRYTAVGQWYWSPVTNKYKPTANVGYYTDPATPEVSYAQACAMVYYPNYTCTQPSWNGPITVTSYAVF